MRRILWYLYLGLTTSSFLLVLYIFGAFTLSSRWSSGNDSLPAFGATFEPGIAFETGAPDRIRILAINGGAMLGLSDLVILEEIEERSGKQIYELFDFFAGSSTGAIISTLLLLPQDATGRPMTAKEAIRTYEEFSAKVFSNSTWHRTKTGFGLFGPIFENTPRVEIAQQLFKDATFGEFLRPAMFPSYSQREKQIILFRNWKAPESNLLLSSLLVAVTAAPAVFPFINLEGYSKETPIFGDAGVVLNAPGEFAYLEARAERPDLKSVVVVTVDTQTRLNIPDETTTHGGLVQWLIPLVKMDIIGQAGVSRDILAAQAAFAGAGIDVSSFELVARVEENVSVYSTDGHTVSAVLSAGRRFIAENGMLIDEVIQTLKNESD